MTKKNIMLLVIAAFFFTFTMNCGDEKGKKDKKEPAKKTDIKKTDKKDTKRHEKTKHVNVKGSDTLVNLVQSLAENYIKENPDKKVSVTGGGSSTGIAALINKNVDIANASRQIKDKEVKKAKDAGIEPTKVIVAVDAISVIVNPDNPVEKIDVETLGKIYRGEVKNWKEVGGKDQKIVLYGRQSNSGTYEFFRKFVLGKKADYSLDMNRMNGNSNIVEMVKGDKGGIGYVGVGYVRGPVKEGSLKLLKVAEKKDGYYASPLNTEDVAAMKYPIARTLQQYVNGKPEGEVKEFMNYIVSDKGQQVVVKNGFFPIGPEHKKYNKEVAGL